VTLPGIPNFRDAGGLPSGTLRPGVVFRSAQLVGLSDEDTRRLSALDVRAVFDLRTSDEVVHLPDALPAGLEATVLDVLADRPHSGAAAVASLVTAKKDRTTVEDVNEAVSDGRACDLMIETYRYLVSLPSAHTAYRTLLSSLSAGEGSTVIHCTAGKDRTGVAAMLLLSALGVEEEVIHHDYLATNRLWRRDAEVSAGLPPVVADTLLSVQPAFLEAAYEAIHSGWGSIDAYLHQQLGLDDARMAVLRARLVE